MVLPAAGNAAGTGLTPTIKVADNETMGTIVLNVPRISVNMTGKILTITFATPYPSSVSVTLTPRNSNPLLRATIVDLTTSSFTISSRIPTSAGTTYVWHYLLSSLRGKGIVRRWMPLKGVDIFLLIKLK